MPNRMIRQRRRDRLYDQIYGHMTQSRAITAALLRGHTPGTDAEIMLRHAQALRDIAEDLTNQAQARESHMLQEPNTHWLDDGDRL